MNILIIEDEPLTARDLSEAIMALQPSATIAAVIPSVKKAVQYLSASPVIDLIFSDIQLEDGLSFEIYKNTVVKQPVIFCTAFNEYAIEAFKNNGIDYLLKPFAREHIAAALDKFLTLRDNFSRQISRNEQLEKLLDQFKAMPAVNAILVYHKDQIIPVKISDVAYFFIQNEITRLCTLSGKIYQTEQTLEQLEKNCGHAFFRINRQYLINAASIAETKQGFNRKLKIILNVPVEEELHVSKNKVAQYLEWLTRA